ncbi:MAG: hypothetical protein AB1793_07640 [Candidatus Thermoplasmatota archaeon]
MISKVVAIGMACLVAAMALSATDSVSAGGDQNQNTHGEDPGYYDEHNNNPFDDDDFPGDPAQNRTGV